MNYILYGEEHFLIRKEIDKIVDKNVTFEKNMNTVFFDATKVSMEDIIADAQTLPFFSEVKVVVISNANFLTSSDDTKCNLEVLEKYMDNPNDSTILIMCCNTTKLDTRKKIVKKLSGVCKLKAFNTFNDMERSQFVSEQLRNRKLHFSRDALNEFYYRIGYSPSRILSELDKIEMYNENIEKEDIIALVQRPLEDNVFDIFTALINRNFKKAYVYWKDFDEQNIDPIALVAMLASQYRFMHQVKILQGKGMNKKEIAQILSAHPYRVEKSMENARKRSEKEIAKTLHTLANLDQQMKSGKIDKKLGFELFLIQEGK